MIQSMVMHQQKKIPFLEWASQSSDLNPIEMLWHDLKRAIHTRHPKNIAELKQLCKEGMLQNSWAFPTRSPFSLVNPTL